MKRSDINIAKGFFHRYIDLVEDIGLLSGLTKSLGDFESFDFTLLEELKDKVYAPGKWTVKDILQHLIDTERIQSYRALRFARKDSTLLPGFDENSYALHAHAVKRSLSDLREEFIITRKSSIALFKSFDESNLSQKGIAFNTELSVLALGFVIVGHQTHHFHVIKERYLPLL